MGSAKFKYLIRAKDLLGPERVPRFVPMPLVRHPSDLDFTFHPTDSYILRSALDGEGTAESHLSGKSLSVGGIRNGSELWDALNTCRSQTNLSELILQKEVPWEKHLTLFYETDFWFCELKDRDNHIETFYWNPLTQTGSATYLKTIQTMLDELNPIFLEHPTWILELGLLHETLFLFQIQPIPKGELKHIFSNNLAVQQVSAYQRFKTTPSLFELLKTEWAAFKYRKHFASGIESVSDVFTNWEFIFHYFRIFCLVNRIKPSGENFAKFLSHAHSNSILGALIQSHLKIASRLRETEVFSENPSQFQFVNPLFVGTGKISGRLGFEIEWVDNLDAKQVYNRNEIKAYLSPHVSILSHFALACAEQKVGLVMGLSKSFIQNHKMGASIEIDFKKGTIHVKM